MKTADKVYPLNSVRIFISLLVLFHHSVKVFFPAIASSAVQSALPSFITEFSLKLSFSASSFFILSGYSLSCAYLRKGRGIDVSRFVVARIARLYPLCLLLFLIEGAIYARDLFHRMGTIGAVETFGVNALLLQAWFPQKFNQLNFPSWALSAEMFFCVCFCLLGTRLWKLSGATLLLTALALYLGGQALAWVTRGDTESSFWAFGPPLHLSSFLLGILVARWLSLKQERKERSSVKAWQANTVLGVSVVALLACVQLDTLSHGPNLYSHGMLAPIFVAMIWSLTVTSTAVTRWLSGKWMVALGNASYSVYLLHVPVLRLFTRYGGEAAHLYPLYVALCVGLGVLSSRLFETPIRSWLMEQFEARRSGKAVEEHSIAAGEPSIAVGEPSMAYSGSVGDSANAD